MMAAHGRLKVYLGATPGAGKTFAMLREGRQRKQRGEDVVIAYVETYGRARIEELLPGLDQITGILQRETIPDGVLDLANEIQFIDISPEALRKRMRHGNIYQPEKVETALANFFRPGNLAALREIALRLVAQSMATSREVM